MIPLRRRRTVPDRLLEEIHCLDDPDPWEDTPAARADIARTNNAKRFHRATRDAWIRATGEPDRTRSTG